MMLSAKIVMRPNAPPANMSNMPRMPPCWFLNTSARIGGIDARQRDVGAEAIDHQRAQGEPDALLELRRLRECGEADMGRELFGGRCHPGLLPCRPVSAALDALPGVTPFLALALWRFGASAGFTFPPAFSTAATAAAEAAGRLHRNLGLDLAFGKEAQPVAWACRSPRPRAASSAFSVPAGSRRFRVDRGLDAAQIDLGIGLAEHVVEAALGQAPLERHLAALKRADRHAGARLLALLALARGLAEPGAIAAAEPLLRVARARIVAQFVQTSCDRHSPSPPAPDGATLWICPRIDGRVVEHARAVQLVEAEPDQRLRCVSGAADRAADLGDLDLRRAARGFFAMTYSRPRRRRRPRGRRGGRSARPPSCRAAPRPSAARTAASGRRTSP